MLGWLGGGFEDPAVISATDKSKTFVRSALFSLDLMNCSIVSWVFWPKQEAKDQDEYCCQEKCLHGSSTGTREPWAHNRRCVCILGEAAYSVGHIVHIERRLKGAPQPSSSDMTISDYNASNGITITHLHISRKEHNLTHTHY